MELKNRHPIIFCICGKARSGKSEVANCIKNVYIKKGKKVVLSPYTKYLKQYISEITGQDINDSNKPRDLLQDISSELIKGKLGKQDFFINRQLEDIDIYSYFFDVIIISDVRFPREIEVLKEKYDNVISIGVNRKNYESDLTVKQKKDITEIALDNYMDYDYMLINESINNLQRDTNKIIDNLGKKV